MLFDFVVFFIKLYRYYLNIKYITGNIRHKGINLKFDDIYRCFHSNYPNDQLSNFAIFYKLFWVLPIIRSRLPIIFLQITDK